MSRSTLGRYVDRHSADMLVDIGRLSTDMHVGRYSIATPSTLGRYPTGTWPILYRHLIGSIALVCVAHSFVLSISTAQATDTVLLLPLWVRGRRRLTFQNISAKQTIYNTQYTTKCRPIYHRQSTDMPPTVHRNVTVEASAECRPTYRPSIDR